MSMIVEIKIGGDVIIYDKDENWNFVFITDTHHPLRYFVGGTEFDPLRARGRSRELKFDIPDGKREWGSDDEKIFNMAHDNLHGEIGNNSSLSVSPKSPADRETVRVTAPAGTVKGTPMGNGKPDWYPDYRYCRYPDGTEEYIGHETAKYATLTFEVTRSFNLVEAGATVDRLPFTDDSTLEIILDNDCLGVGHADDFLMYYDWVRDSTDSRKLFTARKPGYAKSDKSVLSPEGNCDPTRIVPPPLP